MKICLFCAGVSGGGAERVICNLANYLVDHTYDIELLTLSDDEPSYNLSPKIKRTVLIWTKERRNFIYNQVLRVSRFISYLRRNKHIDCYISMLPTPIIMLLLFKSFTKAKIICSERCDPGTYVGMEKMLLKRLSHKANGFIFQTDTAKEWYVPFLKKCKTKVIPNAINEEFLSNIPHPKKKKYIVSAGRLSNQKNFELLLTAFAKISKKFNEYNLVIYGKGPKKENLEELSNKLGIADRVHFAGFSQNLKEELAKAELFVLSSDYEGIPNVLMEAMALGLPCVSTDCNGGGARLLITHNVNGLLVPIRDERKMAEAISSILESSALALRLGDEAKKIVKRFSPDVIYHSWESFICSIVND